MSTRHQHILKSFCLRQWLILSLPNTATVLMLCWPPTITLLLLHNCNSLLLWLVIYNNNKYVCFLMALEKGPFSPQRGHDPKVENLWCVFFLRWAWDPYDLFSKNILATAAATSERQRYKVLQRVHVPQSSSHGIANVCNFICSINNLQIVHVF